MQPADSSISMQRMTAMLFFIDRCSFFIYIIFILPHRQGLENLFTKNIGFPLDNCG
jgi:hypothetical protein